MPCIKISDFRDQERVEVEDTALRAKSLRCQPLAHADATQQDCPFGNRRSDTHGESPKRVFYSFGCSSSAALLPLRRQTHIPTPVDRTQSLVTTLGRLNLVNASCGPQHRCQWIRGLWRDCPRRVGIDRRQTLADRTIRGRNRRFTLCSIGFQYVGNRIAIAYDRSDEQAQVMSLFGGNTKQHQES